MKQTLRALTMSVALVAAAGIVGSVAFPDYAYANNGNGKGNGNSGRDNDRGNSSRADRETGRPAHAGNNGRGALASELGALNAMNANANALANASPDSMPGKLRTYQTATLEARDAVAVQNDAAAAYQELLDLTDEEIAVLYPEGGYEEDLAAAQTLYDETTATAEAELADADDALTVLTGGEDLSDEAMTELNSSLGL